MSSAIHHSSLNRISRFAQLGTTIKARGAPTRKLLSTRRASSSSSSSDGFDNSGNNSNRPSILQTLRASIVLIWRIAVLPLRLVGFVLSNLLRRKRDQDGNDEMGTLVVNGDARANMSAVPTQVEVSEPVEETVVKVAASASPIQGGITTQPTMSTDDEEEDVPRVVSEAATNPAAKPAVEAAPIIPERATRTSIGPVSKARPAGPRWAIASVDLTGKWKLIATEEFKQSYDKYLKQLGQPGWVRSIALGIIGITTEETIQSNEGRNLIIRATNARGVWERLLVSSGADANSEEFLKRTVPVTTADGEAVQAEAWWEENGTVHRSWMRGVEKFGGGNFESKRYLEEGGKVLVCESTFHHNDGTMDDARVIWRFRRV